ncbi:glycosyltransferase [Arthrobacter sp. UM1]|uniref:glycosyltransferase n=1 Tax=Arthrobacter sp. UM1 TaxID=2766776 RepID=UPI001CF6DD17|nr:glycosyltransferase [Arthrobacter sp. UM1]MCB4207227.1 glycosyltransferase [Arthrobacter sp. UM1]
MSFPRPLTAPYAGSPALCPSSTIAVVTTYNRRAMLTRLLESIAADPSPVAAVVVVDNASTDGTDALLAGLDGRLARENGEDVPVFAHRMASNTGGSGGFRAGMEIALSSALDGIAERGRRWLWLMDDDVELIPGGLARLSERGLKADLVHGTRLTAEGAPFFWRHRFDPATGIHLPLPEPERSAPEAETNVACFEGALVSARTADLVGLPDSRFFINSDDTVYGYEASRRVRVIVTDEPLLRKTRVHSSVDLGPRHLNDASDLSRYYAVRNRALMREHLAAAGTLSPAAFGAGTALTVAKELARLALVEVPAQLRGPERPSLGATARRAGASVRSIARGLGAARSLRRELGGESGPEPDARGGRASESAPKGAGS